MTKSKKIPQKQAELSFSPSEEYKTILKVIVGKINSAQTRAMLAVNYELIEVYRDIGKAIYEQQKSAKWGSSVVEQLAEDLKKAFPGIKGFSSRNLWIMKDFYLSYNESEKLQTLSAEISWSHNVAILSRCSCLLEREFYLRMSKKNGWTYRVLINQIDNQNYEKTMLSYLLRLFL